MLINVEEIMELENHHLWYTIVITVTEDAKTCKWTIRKKPYFQTLMVSSPQSTYYEGKK